MRIAALLPCALLATAASAADLGVAQRHIGPPQRTDCPSPWCDQTPRLYVLQGPNDPKQYLGDRISYERPSDWRHYAPMQEQVASLVTGFTSQRDQVAALADWLKHARTSGAHQYTTWPASIVDMWGFPAIQCEEASFLLTAMARLAGIPAMRFITWNNAHAAVRVFADGAWLVADATPTEPDNSTPARIYAPDDPSVIPAFQERPLLTLDNVPVPGSTAAVASFTLFSNEALNEPDKLAGIGLTYASIAFPVTNKFLYFDSQTNAITTTGTPAQRVAIMYHLEAADESCMNDRQSWYADPINFVVPSVMWRTIDNGQASTSGQFYPIGYIQTILPTCGTWRVVYSFSATDMNPAPSALAYADVSLLRETDFAVVRPDMLKPVEGADPERFRTLVEALQTVPTFEQLGGNANP
ncbi:MAG TPA: transglutaminase domain-containing protein [Thermoanaerobaculaceae bacterium]|nr:transglutaminase domain-containing protein [Thermoanaerobaculaceae bacterium]